VRVKSMGEAAEQAEERFYSLKEEHARSLARLDEAEVQLRAASFASRAAAPAPAGARPTAIYRGTSLIRNSPPPLGFHRPLGIVLL